MVQNPLAKAGRENLDFGKGFYVTNIHEQARRWASGMPFLRTVYNFKIISHGRCINLEQI